MLKKIIIIMLLTVYILISLMSSVVFAVNQSSTTDINSVDSNQYPLIKEMIQSLKSKHPNWNFKILYTDIEWKDAIANEYTGHGGSPKNLVPNVSNCAGEWICSICGPDKYYDNGSWHCASEATLEYMMDPRASLNDDDIFQFMELTYTDCNINTLRTMVNGTFLNNDSYINTIIDAGKKTNVNAYYIAARILQEQGTGGSSLSSGQGYQGQYVGYYNVFNIGASGNSKGEIILNGLKKAQQKGWDSLEKSIYGGVEIIASSYIARGQNTLYFQKFDVENSDGEIYWHQYMQNVLAAQNEGTTLRKTFQKLGTYEGEFTFIIPVYKNMPSTTCRKPSPTGTPSIPTTELVRVNVNSSLKLRTSPNGSAMSSKLYANEIVTRLEYATAKVGGTYWDYVMKADGTKGYAARETYDYESSYKLYLVPIETEPEPEPEPPEEPSDDVSLDNVQTDKIKVDSSNNIITVVPDVTLNDLTSATKDSVTAKNQNGEVLSTDAKLATGTVVNDKYTVVMLGDVNEDGETTALDAAIILRYTVGQYELSEIKIKAGSLDGNTNPTALDSAKILRYTIGQYNINLP